MAADNRKYLYLPLEIVVREHDGKIMLAHEAAMAGWTVVIGAKMAIYNAASQLPEGIVITKSATPQEVHQIIELKKHGHKVCTFDEEGIVTFKEFIGNNVRYGHETIKELEGIFFWGDEQRNAFSEFFPQLADKTHVTGSPRFEFWKYLAAEVYADQAQQYRESYGDYIFFPTSFGIGNNILGKNQGLKLTKDHSGVLSEDMQAFMEGQAEQNLICYREYVDLLLQLVEKYQETTFVIRPHPSENQQSWQALAEKFDNVHVIYEGAVTPWILGSHLMIHFKSTTSIEAYLMGKPVVTYMPDLPEYMKRYELKLPLSVSQVASSRDELFEMIEASVSIINACREIADNPELNKWISVQRQSTSAERIVAILDTFSVTVSRKLLPPTTPLVQKIKDKIEEFLCFINRSTTIKGLLPGKFKRNPNRLEYGRHKIQGLDIATSARLLEIISKRRSEHPSGVTISALAEKIFVVEKNAGHQ